MPANGHFWFYGLPGLPLAALGLPLYIYLPTFYAEQLGLGLAARDLDGRDQRLRDLGHQLRARRAWHAVRRVR